MAAWKSLSNKQRTFDDKEVITTRTITSEKVQRKIEPLGRTDAKVENKSSNKAKWFWIIVCGSTALIYLASVLL